MSPRLPPRREPRVLAVTRSPTGIQYAVADPWELRSAGSTRCTAASLGPALLRIARREKPTLLVAEDQVLLKAVSRVALRLGVAVVTQALPKLPLAIAQDLYPELPLRAPTPGLAGAASLAISAVLYAEPPIPSRHYAKTRRKRSDERAA